MEQKFVPSGRQRPLFERSELTHTSRWTGEAIPDLNADAMEAVCNSCKARLSWTQWLNSSDWRKRPIDCHRCGAGLYSDDPCLDPTPELLAEVAAPGYLDRTWYHATQKKYWAREVRSAEDGNLIVHAGSMLSALARADYFREEYGGPVYLHSFKLRSNRAICTTVLEDMMERWQEDLREPVTMGVCPTRGKREPYSFRTLGEGCYLGALYYNRYEVPGDISILFHAPLVQLNTVTTVELQEDESIDSSQF